MQVSQKLVAQLAELAAFIGDSNGGSRGGDRPGFGDGTARRSRQRSDMTVAVASSSTDGFISTLPNIPLTARCSTRAIDRCNALRQLNTPALPIPAS